MRELPVVRRLHAAVTPASIDAVHDLLVAFWSDVGDVSPRIRFGFDTAVAEIAGNIVEHSSPGPDGRFTLELVGAPAIIRATFTDQGVATAFDRDAVHMASVEQESGRGLALASAGVDRIRYRRDGVANVWELESDRP